MGKMEEKMKLIIKAKQDVDIARIDKAIQRLNLNNKPNLNFHDVVEVLKLIGMWDSQNKKLYDKYIIEIKRKLGVK
jgi:hypothetical protein